MALATVAVLLVGCTSGDDVTASPGSTAPVSPGTTVVSSASLDQPESTEPLALGELSLQTSPTGVSASAEAAERCGSSRWQLTGPVTFEQASPVPDQCFGGAHAFDTNWYGLSLPPGEYELSLTIQRGLASGTTSAAFQITGT